MAVAQASGAKQRKQSDKGRVRHTNFKHAYRRDMKDLHLDAEDLRFTAIVGKGGAGNFHRLDGVAESVDWADENAELGGNVTLHKPDAPGGELKINRSQLGHGTIVKADMLKGGRWRELWQMRVWDPESTIDDRTLQLPLFDDVKFLRESRDDFIYRTHKTRKKYGWYCHEILIDVARRYNIRLGKIAKGKHRIKKLEMKNASPIDVIIKAYKQERQANGARFVIQWGKNGLNVVPLERGDVLYKLGPQILSGTVTQKRAKGFCTALTARATVGEKKAKKKIVAHVRSQKGIQRYGFIHRQVTLDNADTEKELEKLAKRELAERMVVKHRIEFSHVGLLELRQGDIIDLTGLQEWGFTGKRDPDTGLQNDIFWVSRVAHSWSPGTLVSEISTTQRDPFKDLTAAQKKKDREKREAKRKKRQRG